MTSLAAAGAAPSASAAEIRADLTARTLFACGASNLRSTFHHGHLGLAFDANLSGRRTRVLVVNTDAIGQYDVTATAAGSDRLGSTTTVARADLADSLTALVEAGAS